MATASPGSEAFPNGLTWQVITPQRARAALLRRSIAALERPISAPPRRQPHPAQTPSSPTNRRSQTAADTEEAQHAISITQPTQTSQEEGHTTSITESANRLAQEITETHNTKLIVFRAFCAAFEETANQFITKPEHDLAQHLSTTFLDFWSQALSPIKSAPAPTYC
ncbi:hypothetical protein S40285_09531 [Stachybotrys chlorohalonatus IBT 40285]|uniref:Uncharacterized protein n=1 Tax=Stachybotrys chlorohalonatus (strain IBT 40285) TaxID=1283841 RepID=A0A084QX38_STAC4|nr:hypothetical protein S40285_09531 [Stachybotrys chlorohalonata IBT 40285]